jgi:hypothetical protein
MLLLLGSRQAGRVLIAGCRVLGSESVSRASEAEAELRRGENETKEDWAGSVAGGAPGVNSMRARCECEAFQLSAGQATWR